MERALLMAKENRASLEKKDQERASSIEVQEGQKTRGRKEGRHYQPPGQKTLEKERQPVKRRSLKKKNTLC